MALVLDEALAAADTYDVRSRQFLSSTCLKIGKALLEQGRFSEARKSHARAIAISEELSGADPLNAEPRVQLAESYASFGKLEERTASAATNRAAARRSWLEARSWYERSRTVWLDLTGLNKGKPQEVAEAISRCDSALAK
jgi:tetratricopeptide (TPR) repeat protein